MKVLIIYSTKGGVSRQCAQILADQLKSGMQVDVFDIKDAPPSPESYDVAVIGGSIRMARIRKNLRSYIKANSDTLNNMQTALFLCCGITEDFDDYVKLNFPKSIFITAFFPQS